ncbi:MAG: ECF-type sigma factor [Pseudomonadota bacterium]
MEVTTLIQAANDGDQESLDRLAEILYPELKAMARNRTRASSGMGATTLVGETFVQLLSGGRLKSQDRQQFFGLAATIMRRVIVDEVRYLTAEKRAGDDVTLVNTIIGGDAHENAEFVLQVDELLSILNGENPRWAKVFECRYFAGLTTAETAECLGLSERSVERAWSDARARMAELLEVAES